MGVIKFLRDVTGLFNWSTDENPTTQQDYQNAVKNWQETERNLVDISLWQPETNYAVDDIVQTPALSSGLALICTVSGQSGTTEQTYTGVSVGSTVTDGTVTWTVVRPVTSAGGTITGKIIRSGGTGFASRDVDTSFLYIGGSTSDSNGAYLTLYGKDHANAGRFILTAKDGTNSALLQGLANETLTWAGKEIERVNASSFSTASSSYIRFESGLQICWGSETGVANTNVTVTYAAPFSTSPRITLSVGSSTVTYGWSNVSATAITLKTSSTSGVIVYYMAIGKWK